jgi:spore coat protein U-like protein
MRIRRLSAIVAVLWLASLAPAVAQSGRTKTANLQVTAEVVANCNMTANNIAFGPYDPVVANKSAHLERIDIVSMQCTPGTAVRMELDNGQHASGGQRAMTGPPNGRLSYEIYRSNNHNVRFGTGADAQDKVAGSNGRLGFWMYSRLPAGQNMPVGSYSDTVLVTITY